MSDEAEVILNALEYIGIVYDPGQPEDFEAKDAAVKALDSLTTRLSRLEEALERSARRGFRSGSWHADNARTALDSETKERASFSNAKSWPIEPDSETKGET